MQRSIFFPLITLCLSALLVACSSSNSESGLIPTIYYKPTVHADKSKCAPSELKDLVSTTGKVLVTLCQKDYWHCLMQGSCFVYDQQKLNSYNYHSTKDGIALFVEVDLNKCPYGYGAQGYCLDPYFSIAADLSIHKMGDVFFVPRLEGAVLPNGEIHDGYVIVRDSGGKILGASRFDFFTGFLDHLNSKNTLAQLGFGDPKNRFEYYKLSEEEAEKIRSRRGYPGLKKTLHQAEL